MDPLSAEQQRKLVLSDAQTEEKNEGHTASNDFYIEHMQTKFAAHHLDGKSCNIKSLESLDLVIGRSEDVEMLGLKKSATFV